jgi:hypothetical protein
MDFTWLGIQICICWSHISTTTKCRGRYQKTSQYQVWPPFVTCRATHLLWHRVHQAVDCGLWNVVPLLWSCWILAGTGTHCLTLRSRASQTCSMWWHISWGNGRTGKCSAFRNCVQILTSWGPCIIILKHEVMADDEWHDNGLQDLVTVYPCIQNAIDKM